MKIPVPGATEQAIQHPRHEGVPCPYRTVEARSVSKLKKTFQSWIIHFHGGTLSRDGLGVLIHTQQSARLDRTLA